MPRQLQISDILCTEISPGTWQLAWSDPRTKRYIRRRRKFQTITQLREFARAIAERLIQDATRAECPESINIPDALAAAIASSRSGNTHTIYNYKLYAAQFATWIQTAHPDITDWSDIRPHIIQQYQASLEARGLAYDSIRQRMAVVRATSRFFASNYPEYFRDYARAVRPAARKTPWRPEAIPTNAVLQILQYARESNPALYPIMALQAACGLRILEAINLRECDHDPIRHTITIAPTDHHTPKNLSSHRTIPIPAPLSQLLSAIAPARNPKGPNTYIFQPPLDPETPYPLDQISKSLTRIINNSRRDRGTPLILPRKLRSVFATEAAAAGAPQHYIQQYMGHSPQTVIERHYQQSAGLEQMRAAIADKMTPLFFSDIATLLQTASSAH